MSRMVQVIKQSVDDNCGNFKIVEQILDAGCQIGLAKVSCEERIVVKMDRKPQRGKSGTALVPEDTNKKCDFLFAGKVDGSKFDWIVLLELKSGRLEEGAIKQLRASAKRVERLISSKSELNSTNLNFRPFAACGGSRPDVARRIRQKKNKIKLKIGTRDFCETVEVIRCGYPLQPELIKKRFPANAKGKNSK